jgi:hypothetical protein
MVSILVGDVGCINGSNVRFQEPISFATCTEHIHRSGCKSGKYVGKS